MLNPKVTTCPKCGKIKSNTKPCAHCGFSNTVRPKTFTNEYDLDLAILKIMKENHPREYSKIRKSLTEN